VHDEDHAAHCRPGRHEIAEQFWGELHGQSVDPFGHRWNIAQRLREVSADEIAAAAAKLFGGGNR
jgi:PhnB protein